MQCSDTEECWLWMTLDWASGLFWNVRYKAAFWRLLCLTNAPMIVRQVNACYTSGLCGKCTRSDILVKCWSDHCDPVPTTCVFDRCMWLSTYCSVCLPMISECSERNSKSLSWWVQGCWQVLSPTYFPMYFFMVRIFRLMLVLLRTKIVIKLLQLWL